MSAAAKLPRDGVLPRALHIAETLRPFCHRLELAGSLRRETPLVGDIEIVAIPHRPVDLFGQPVKGPTALETFLVSKGVALSKNGDRYKQFAYGSLTVDLFLPTVETWGSVLTIRTGSWEFSKWLVTSQAARGAAPNEIAFREGRLYAGGRLLATPEEEDVFAALGLSWIEPALRKGPIDDPTRVEPVWRFE